MVCMGCYGASYADIFEKPQTMQRETRMCQTEIPPKITSRWIDMSYLTY